MDRQKLECQSRLQDLVFRRLLLGNLYRPLEAQLKDLKSSIPELQGELDFMRIQIVSQDAMISEFQNLYERWPSLTFQEKRPR